MNPNKQKIISTAFPELAQGLKQQETNDLLRQLIEEVEEVKEKDTKIVFKGELKGEPGYTPIKGIDYDDGYTPIKDVDYFDGSDGYSPIPGVDFEVPDEKKIYNSLLEQIPEPIQGERGKAGKDGSPDSPEQIIDKVNTLEGVLEPKVLKGYFSIDDVVQTIKKNKSIETRDIKGMPINMNDQRWHGGGISNITNLIVAGTNIVITGSGTSSDPYIISATGGMNEVPVTGVVDGSNQTFTVTQIPTYLVIDGAWYKELDNNAVVQWSYVGLTITTNVTPNGAIFGIL